MHGRYLTSRQQTDVTLPIIASCHSPSNARQGGSGPAPSPGIRPHIGTGTRPTWAASLRVRIESSAKCAIARAAFADTTGPTPPLVTRPAHPGTNVHCAQVSTLL